MRDLEQAIEGPWQVAAGTKGNQRFGALLKALRERSGISPQQLADQADVHVSFVRGIERGAQAPSVATARPLLACMKEQDRIRWTDDGPFDLLIRDPKIGGDVAFEFKAKVKGQNRRTDADPAVVAVVVAEAMTKLAENLPQVDAYGPVRAMAAVGEAMDRLRSSLSGGDATFGRVVRLLAAADEETLTRVESLLRDSLASGDPGS
ncbi:helix-turn-helix domain-containing protein [Blastococcus sp. SYSU DS0753]